MSLGQLIVKLGLDAAEFTQGMSASEAKARSFAGKMGSDIQAGATLAAGAIAALGVAAVGAFKIINDQVEAIASFQQLSEKIGDTAENLASLKKASDVSGVSMDSIAAASVKLTAALSKTDEEGQGAAKAIKALGLDFNDFKKLSPVDQIDTLAKSFNKFEDGANKTATAVALFGKSGAEVIPFLNDLAEGSERQITLTQDQIKAADDFSKSIARLGSDFQTWKSQLSAEVIPTMGEVLTQLADLKKYAFDGGESVNLLGVAFGGLKTVFESAVILATDVAFVFKGVGREIGGVAAQIVALGSLDFKGFSVIGQSMKDDAAKARKDLDEFQKKFLSGNGPAASTFKPSDNYGAGAAKPVLRFDGVKTPKDKGGGADKQSEAEKYLANLQKQLEATDKLTVNEALLRDIELGRLGAITPMQSLQLQLVAQQIDQARERAAIEKAAAEAQKLDSANTVEQFKSTNEELKKRDDIGRALRESVMTDQEKINALEFQYGEYLAKDVISLDTYGRLMDQLRVKVEALEPAFINFQDLASTAANSLADGLTNAIIQGKSLGDVFRSLVKELAAMIIKAIIFKAISGIVKTYTGIDISGARAAGGPVNTGSTYLVGEKGPELFTPSQSGKITTTQDTFRPMNVSGGGTSNVYNISNVGAVKREEFMSGLNRAQAGAVSDVRDNQKRRRA